MTTSVLNYPCGISGLGPVNLTVQIYPLGATDVAPAATLTFTENANGAGYYRVSTTVTGVCWCRILNGTGVFDEGWINFVGGDCFIDDSAISVLGVLANSIVVALEQSILQVAGYNPNTGPSLCLTLGDDYYAADSNAKAFTINGAFASWVGATVALVMTVNGVTQSITTAAFTPTGTSRPVSFDIPRAVTLALGVGEGRYAVVVTLATSLHINTVVKSGCFSVSP